MVASDDPLLAESVRAELIAAENAAGAARRNPSSHLRVEVKAPLTEGELAALNAAVESKQADGYLWLSLKPGTTRLEATYTSRGSADFVGKDRMQDAIGHALVREELVKRGATSEEIQALLQDVDLKTQQVKNGTAVAADASNGFWGAYVMAFMLYFAVVFYGVNVAHSVVAEKTSRVFEVMLASAKAESLMLGKLLGVGAVGLTQMAIWIAFVFLLSASSLWMTLGLGGLAGLWSDPAAAHFLCALFHSGIFLLQRIERRSGRDRQPGVGGTTVQHDYRVAAGAWAGVHCLHPGQPWRVASGVVVAVSPVHADCDVFAHGRDGGAGLAARSFSGADGVVHLRDGMGGYANLPRRHPDVWQAADTARDIALAKVQLIVQVQIEEEKSIRWVHKITG